MGRLGFYAGALLLLSSVVQGEMVERVKRQNTPSRGDQLIDSIFNIPITVIKETASAAQSVSPDNSQKIDNIFKIPVSTLEAVGNLVKVTSSQRRQQSPEDIQRIQQERRDRMYALKQQKLQLKSQRMIRRRHHDPLGVNTLASALVDKTKFFGDFFGDHHGLGGNHGGHGGHGGHGSHGSHGGHPGFGLHDILASHGGHGSHGSHTYEVHEDVEEIEAPPAWPGFGWLFGLQSQSNSQKVDNKIAPNDDKDKVSRQQNFPRKKNNKPTFEKYEPTFENKIAPRNSRITFQD